MNNRDDEYRSMLYECANRYLDMQIVYDEARTCATIITDLKLYGFTLEFKKGCKGGLPLMKLNRWLGYIQGVLIERGLTTVEDERNWTRPRFRHLDFPNEN